MSTQLKLEATVSYAVRHIENVLSGDHIGSAEIQWGMAEVWFRRAEIIMRTGGLDASAR